MQYDKTTKLTMYGDKPTGITSSWRGSNLDIVGFNLGLITLKKPLLAIEIMQLYNEARGIRLEDPKAPEENHILANNKLDELMSTAFEDREELSKAIQTHNKSPYAEHFDKQYAAAGGLAKLLDLYNSGLSNPTIAKHFGMSEQGMSSALKKLLGKQYMSYHFRELATRLKPLTISDIL